MPQVRIDMKVSRELLAHIFRNELWILPPPDHSDTMPKSHLVATEKLAKKMNEFGAARNNCGC
uniref:Uncharacterized protein n=1 Tax=Physcomitrium patens TaxID=3218 RepID=A0A7I4ENT6_PHYPA